jgi:hypothetical protein
MPEVSTNEWSIYWGSLRNDTGIHLQIGFGCKTIGATSNRPRKYLSFKTPNQVFFGINPPAAFQMRDLEPISTLPAELLNF